MSLTNAIVWIDHTKAQLIHFDLDAAESASLKSHSTHPHPHQRHADSHAAEDDNTRFFADIATALDEATGILIVGPAQEKTVFAAYLKTHAPALAARIEGVETVDHPSGGELLAYARKYFIKTSALK